MSLVILTEAPKSDTCKAFITVYEPIAGWKAIHYWWNSADGGFWEPWQTGMFAFATKQEAIVDAKLWAEAEELPYYEGE
jgi:hypothetical protein